MPAWRTVGGGGGEKASGGNYSGRPDLLATLEHYGIRARGSGTQMVSCPGHDDRSPSLSADYDKQLWSCFSCGKGGSSWDLIMMMEGDCDFRRARAVAANLGLATSDDGGSDSGLRGQSERWRSAVPSGTGSRVANSGWVPAWRR